MCLRLHVPLSVFVPLCVCVCVCVCVCLLAPSPDGGRAQFTWADVCLFDLLESVAGTDSGALALHPRLQAYVAVVNERPAIKALKASDKWYD